MTFEEIKKDRDAGTPGPWWCHFGDETVTCNCRYVLAEYGGMGSLATIDVAESDDFSWGDDNGPSQAAAMANARRIARVPELEEAYLTLTAANAVLQERVKELEIEVMAAQQFGGGFFANIVTEEVRNIYRSNSRASLEKRHE